ncbi:hypothetical protein B0H15DRAFT_1000900 [Mycena belliarum]|uniref:Uncharacterized protein n=1 Tax=Mycena belliarum TaxID=1033014 RepID=A0AAD6TUH0_9AGAR|nr:hypothetical protein B0H15DRAFT_1000900 [Mycena belliae]
MASAADTAFIDGLSMRVMMEFRTSTFPSAFIQANPAVFLTHEWVNIDALKQFVAHRDPPEPVKHVKIEEARVKIEDAVPAVHPLAPPHTSVPQGFRVVKENGMEVLELESDSEMSDSGPTPAAGKKMHRRSIEEVVEPREILPRRHTVGDMSTRFFGLLVVCVDARALLATATGLRYSQAVTVPDLATPAPPAKKPCRRPSIEEVAEPRERHRSPPLPLDGPILQQLMFPTGPPTIIQDSAAPTVGSGIESVDAVPRAPEDLWGLLLHLHGPQMQTKLAGVLPVFEHASVQPSPRLYELTIGLDGPTNHPAPLPAFTDRYPLAPSPAMSADSCEGDISPLLESDTLWQDGGLRSRVRIGPFRVTTEVTVQRVEYVDFLPSLYPVLAVPTAIVVDLAHPKYNIEDKHKQLRSIDALIKNKDNDSMSGNTGSGDSKAWVTFEEGSEPIECRRSRLKCTGSFFCERVDRALINVERRDLDPASRDAVFAAQRQTRRDEGTTTERRVAEMIKIMREKPCPAKDHQGIRCAGVPILKKKANPSRKHDFWVGCSEWKKNSPERHRATPIPDDVEEKLFVRVFSGHSLASDQSKDTAPCSAIVHPSSGLKKKICGKASHLRDLRIHYVRAYLGGYLVLVITPFEAPRRRGGGGGVCFY